jgi:hypothetical protein
MVIWRSRAWHEKKARKAAARAAEIARLRAIEDARETMDAMLASVVRHLCFPHTV